MYKRKNKSQQIAGRVVDIAIYTMIKKTTVRETAKAFGISKSTVWLDLHWRLSKFNPNLVNDVESVLKTNLRERHLRGGQATKRRWEQIRMNLENNGKDVNIG